MVQCVKISNLKPIKITGKLKLTLDSKDISECWEDEKEHKYSKPDAENTFKNENKSSDGEKMFLRPNKVSAQPVSHLGRSVGSLFVFLGLFLKSGSSSEQTCGTFLLFPPRKLVKEKFEYPYFYQTVTSNYLTSKILWHFFLPNPHFVILPLCL